FWSSTTRTLSAAAWGIPTLLLPIALHVSRRNGVLLPALRRDHSRLGPRRGSVPAVARHIRQLVHVGNEGDAAVAGDGRTGDAGHDAVILLDALDDDLLMAAQLVHDDAEARAFARLDDDDDAIGDLLARAGNAEQVAHVQQRNDGAAKLQRAERTKQAADIGTRRTQTFDDRGNRNDVIIAADLDHHAVHDGQR